MPLSHQRDKACRDSNPAVDYVRWINLPAAPVALRLRCARIPRPTGCAGESKTMFFMTRSEGRYVPTSRERGKSRWMRSRPPQYPEALTTSHDRRPTGTPWAVDHGGGAPIPPNQGGESAT